MKTITRQVTYNCTNGADSLTDEIFREDAIFFDIETTGFSPTASSVYLIGCMYRSEDKIVIRQFFAETKTDEGEVIQEFMNLLEQFTTIITFNGIGFDIPFVKGKCEQLGIPEHFHNFQYIDLFKEVSRIKYLLKFASYKQKSIEAFLEIARDDEFSGGELINVYADYLHTKSPEGEALLLLHNYEDVLGMIQLLPMLSYSRNLSSELPIRSAEVLPFTGYDGTERQELIVTLENHYPVPKRVSCQYQGFYISMNKDVTKVRIPVYDGELKFFYPNYKDYFYLPLEDMAMHKSVASFVDKEYREKAKASTCYTRKTGRFLPQCEAVMNPAFKENHKDKTTYFELTDDFLASEEMLQRYIRHIFENMKKMRR